MTPERIRELRTLADGATFNAQVPPDELRELLDLAEASRWIPTSERVPEDQRRVLFAVRSTSDGLPVEGVGLGWWSGEDWVDVETDEHNDSLRWAPGEVAAWRELPPLPPTTEEPSNGYVCARCGESRTGVFGPTKICPECSNDFR